MARKVTHTLTVVGRLECLTPFHVGAAEDSAITDMALAIDGLGRYYIPGTSLGGAIRALSQAQEEKCLWGFAEGDDKGNASHVIVDDAPIVGVARPELWHGNGIDRRWGTAADGIKYDREVLPKGTAFDFRVSIEVVYGTDVDRQRGFLAWLVDTLCAGELVLGAGGTRGLGRMKLIAPKCTEHDWATAEGIFAWLEGLDGEDQRTAWMTCSASYQAPAHPRLRIELQWQPRGPLMSRSARDGLVVDGLPFVSRRENGQLALTLPGAGIKGAWRVHAERIVRTVIGRDHVAGKHHDQVDVPIVRELFGRARPEDPKRGQVNPDGRKKGRLGFETCYADFALSDDGWDALDRKLEGWHGPPGPERPLALAMHVAVDRWTGGAAESLLYNSAEPIGVAWNPLVLYLNTEGEPLVEIALLWLTLRDFCAGRIPLGYGVNRGYGDVEVTGIRLSGWDGLEAETVDLQVSSGSIDAKPIYGLIERISAAWSQWLSDQGRENSND